MRSLPSESPLFLHSKSTSKAVRLIDLAGTGTYIFQQRFNQNKKYVLPKQPIAHLTNEELFNDCSQAGFTMSSDIYVTFRRFN